MGLHTIQGILFFTVLLSFTDIQFTTAKILPERYHVRHEGGHRQPHKIHHPMERHDQGMSKNHSRTHSDEIVRRNLSTTRRRRHGTDDLMYEMEVEEVQNTSICSYTIQPVEDKSGNWMLKNLQHIKCNKVGNKCQQSDKPHCCIQTYKMVDLKFSNSSMQQVKIYTGCVCAYSTLPKVKKPLKLTNY